SDHLVERQARPSAAPAQLPRRLAPLAVHVALCAELAVFATGRIAGFFGTCHCVLALARTAPYFTTRDCRHSYDAFWRDLDTARRTDPFDWCVRKSFQLCRTV